MHKRFRRNAPPDAIRGMIWLHLRGFKHDEDREHYADALRRAGLEVAQVGGRGAA